MKESTARSQIRTLPYPYRLAIGSGAVGLAAVGVGIATGTDTPALALVAAAAAPPVAVLFAVRGRMGTRVPGRALVGGAVIGPVVAIASHALVAAFAAAFFLGFGESGRHLLDSLRLDPKVTAVLASPWVLLLIAETVAVAPLTEEAGKALGAALFRPTSRQEAFLAGVSAGAGFAVVENLLYAGVGAAFGGPWPAIVLGRALGAAVHPLASGVVVLGWWEWKQGRDPLTLVRRFLAGAGVHALWNGSLVALLVVQTAYGSGVVPRAFGVATLCYMALLGAVLAGALWKVAGDVAADRPSPNPLRTGDARAIAAWTVLAASLLLPVAMLIRGFPGFYFG